MSIAKGQTFFYFPLDIAKTIQRQRPVGAAHKSYRPTHGKSKYLDRVVGVLSPLFSAICDAIEFHWCANGDYKTPWYSLSWVDSPYTNFQLALRKGREYWTMNAVQNERWLIREVRVGDVTFWTTIQRIPV